MTGIARLMFEIIYNDVAVLYVSNDAMVTFPISKFDEPKINTIIVVFTSYTET